MKLQRLGSTTQRPSQEAIERARESVDERVRRVEAGEGVEGDRERSLQQELDEAAQKIPGEVEQPNVQNQARDVANRLADLPEDAAKRLIRPGSKQRIKVVDENA